MLHLPQFQFDWIRQMSGSALAVACLGLLEALSIAKAIAHQTRQPLDYNRQCLAEGLANFCGGFFQCLPGSGSLTRSAINFQAGAVDALVGGLCRRGRGPGGLASSARWAEFIPKAALAGILLVTAAGSDRLSADRPCRAGKPLRRLVGPGHGLVGGADRGRVFDPHRRRPVDSDVRAPCRPAEGRAN